MNSIQTLLPSQEQLPPEKSWDQQMRERILAQREKEESNGKSSTSTVSLCLNVRVPVDPNDPDKTIESVRNTLGEQKVHYNPFNMSIDAIGTNNSGVNLGISVEEKDLPQIEAQCEIFSIGSITKNGQVEVKPTENLPFDYRDGSGGKSPSQYMPNKLSSE